VKKYLLLPFLCFVSPAFGSTEQICKDGSVAINSDKALIDVCSKYGAEEVIKFKAGYDDKLGHLLDLFEACTLNKSNCDNYADIQYQNTNGKPVRTVVHYNLTEVMKGRDIIASQATLLAEVYAKNCMTALVSKNINGCIADYKKEQDVVDFASTLVTFASLGLIPPSVSRIDMGDLEHGYIMGGDGATLVSIRDSVLHGIGISGDVEKVLKNPTGEAVKLVKEAGKATEQIATQIKEKITNACGNLCGNWSF
jgi:hypothetical protein